MYKGDVTCLINSISCEEREWDADNKPTRFDNRFIVLVFVKEGEGDPAPILKRIYYNLDTIKSIEVINAESRFPGEDLESLR
jgi:hypothetical protein